MSAQRTVKCSLAQGRHSVDVQGGLWLPGSHAGCEHRTHTTSLGQEGGLRCEHTETARGWKNGCRIRASNPTTPCHGDPSSMMAPLPRPAVITSQVPAKWKPPTHPTEPASTSLSSGPRPCPVLDGACIQGARGSWELVLTSSWSSQDCQRGVSSGQKVVGKVRGGFSWDICTLQGNLAQE